MIGVDLVMIHVVGHYAQAYLPPGNAAWPASIYNVSQAVVVSIYSIVSHQGLSKSADDLHELRVFARIVRTTRRSPLGSA